MQYIITTTSATNSQLRVLLKTESNSGKRDDVMSALTAIKSVDLPAVLSGLQIASLVRNVVTAHNEGDFVTSVIFRDDFYLELGQQSPIATACLSVCATGTDDRYLRARGQYDQISVVSVLPASGIIYPSGCTYVAQVIDASCRFMNDLVVAYHVAAKEGGVVACTIDELLA